MRKRIVIVGGGYGGIALVRRLQKERSNASITLIDRLPYHTHLTEIHQVAAGLRAPESVSIPLDNLQGVHFLQATVTGLDAGAKEVETTAGPVGYDYLVLALGSVDTDFGVPGVRDWALNLHSLTEAEEIRSQLDRMGKDGHVLVAGGGLTGVELAAAIATRPEHSRPRLTLVEAAPAILPMLPSALQQTTHDRLTRLGVVVRTATRIAQVEEGLLHTADGESIAFDLMVWSCGVRANPLIERLGIPVDRAGRALVDANLATELDGVFVLGDCAAGAPPTAQIACQHGAALAVHLAGLLRGKRLSTSKAQMKGTLVDLGDSYAVGTFGNLPMTGWIPAVMKHANAAKWMYNAGRLSAAKRYLLAKANERIS